MSKISLPSPSQRIAPRMALALALALAAPLASLPGFVTQAQAAPTIGTSAGVRGRVFVTTTGAQREARVRDAIRLQDEILTKEDSALQILLRDRTTFTVGQNANLTITRFIYDPAQDAGEVAAQVTKGAFRFMSGNIGKADPTAASLSTPTATIGIRGTFFEGVVGEDAVGLAMLAGFDLSGVDADGASIVVLRGPGKKRNTIDRTGAIVVSNAAGTSRIARPGYAVFVASRDTAPSAPFKLTREMQDYLDFFLRSEPNGPAVNPTGLDATGAQASGQNDVQTPVDTLDPLADEVGDGILDDNIVFELDEVISEPETGGESTEGENSGGESTGGEGTGGESTGSEDTGGESTGGESTGGEGVAGETLDGF